MYDYSFWRELCIVLDELCNVLMRGYAGETMSARAFRVYRKGRLFGRLFMPPIDWFFGLFQKPDAEVNAKAGRVITAHCERAFWKEVLRRDMHPEYRDSQ